MNLLTVAMLTQPFVELLWLPEHTVEAVVSLG